MKGKLNRASQCAIFLAAMKIGVQRIVEQTTAQHITHKRHKLAFSTGSLDV
ncbi:MULTISPECIES: hypothetical protein [unclassified Vibrio]|uniref:Transposase n=1 Tax=Vibrio sp. HB236076 TaxID=3232307 RepID=A0AB39HL90_9VIBR|nr:hypothetical protein [Vibrio sp. HB161653]MDP5252569.1 hypothetical protein [Vibrio sp. HB161653]